MNYYGYITEIGKWRGDKINLEPFIESRVCMTIRKVKEQRTDNQNRYLHAILNILKNEMGIEAEDLKSYFKYSCLFKDLSETIYPEQEFYNYDIATYLRLKDEELNKGLIKAESLVSTKNLDTYQFTLLIEFIRDYSSKNEICYIMTPEEFYKLKKK